MNTIGVHALVWVGGWSAEEASRATASSRAAGYDLIEIPVLDPTSVDTALTRRLLDDNGLLARCSLGLTHATDISSEDRESVARGRRLLYDAVAVTRDLGATYLGGVIYSALGRYSAPPTPRGRAHCVETLAAVAERARASDITLGVEVVNRYESNLINTTSQALKLIDDVGAPNITVHLDTYHMNIEEADLTAPVIACAHRLGYVHVGESHRGYLGTGNVRFDEFFTALSQIGYHGPITFESFSSAIVAPHLSNTLAIWRDTWIDSVDLATKAHAFIQRHLERTRPAPRTP